MTRPHSDRNFLAKRYARDAVIRGAAVGIFGAGFGVLAIDAGFSVLQALAMSLLVFTGASQFSAASVLSTGGDPASAIGAALLLAARNGLYGMTMAGHIDGSLGKRMAAAHITIDESTALGVGQDNPDDVEGAFFAGGLSVFFFWNLGTLAGALGGQALGDADALGLDAAFASGFISLAMPALRSSEGRTAAIAGSVIAAVGSLVFRPGIPIILAGLGAFVAYRIHARGNPA
ncbi:MAG: AzlC family ABC transporter permease [Acidimicrobiales bacterium]